MHLILQYYNDPDPERQKEYDACLKFNIDNPAIKSIHDIIEPETTIPEELKHEKHKIIPVDVSKTGSIPGRLTFKYAIDYANQTFPPGEVFGIINLDTFLDLKCSAWEKIRAEFFEVSPIKKALSLSRYEYNWDGTYGQSWSFKGNSADGWFLQTPTLDIPDCNFSVGNCPSCDNGIQYRFHLAGYRVFNWAKKYRLFHLDICRGHVQGKYMIITDKTDKSNPGGVKSQTAWFCCPYLPWEIYLYSEEDIDGRPEVFDKTCRLLIEPHHHFLDTTRINVSDERLQKLWDERHKKKKNNKAKPKAKPKANQETKSKPESTKTNKPKPKPKSSNSTKRLMRYSNR